MEHGQEISHSAQVRVPYSFAAADALTLSIILYMIDMDCILTSQNFVKKSAETLSMLVCLMAVFLLYHTPPLVTTQ